MSTYFHLNKEIYDIIRENLRKSYDCTALLSNLKLLNIPIKTYKDEYARMISQFPQYNEIKNYNTIPDDKIRVYIALLFCKYITLNLIKPKIDFDQSDFLFINHKNFKSVEKLTLPTLKKHFELINNKFPIKDYDKIIKLKADKLRVKLIEIIQDHVSKGLVKYTISAIEETTKQPDRKLKKNSTSIEPVIIYHDNFTSVKNLSMDELILHVAKIYSTFKLKNFDDLFKQYKGEALRKKLIEIVEDYISKGLLKHKPTSGITNVMDDKKLLKESPKKSPLTPLIGREEKVAITVKKATNDYMNAMKKELARLETTEFNIEKLRKDINNDNFIKKAIDGHIKALEFKYRSYAKLSQIDWQGTGKDKDNTGKGEVNLNEIITNMQAQVLQKIKYIKENNSMIKEKREELLKIIDDPDNGIESIKGKSRETLRMSLIKIIYMFIEIPIFFFKGFNNFVLTGPAGSGKTKVAGVIANLMRNLGILVTKNVIMATKQNLVGQYLGQSGPKTRNVLSNGLEGVVFIDEAYTLTPCDKQNTNVDHYAEEVVGELINFMDKFIGCIVIIVAGYKDKMTECFLTFNEGIARRFPKMIELTPYSSGDLYNIFEIFLNDTIDVKQFLKLDQRKYIKAIIATLNENNIFTNQAGDMLNLSKIIGEDAILNNKKYDKKLIKLSFKKFCLAKNIAIDFE